MYWQTIFCQQILLHFTCFYFFQKTNVFLANKTQSMRLDMLSLASPPVNTVMEDVILP